MPLFQSRRTPPHTATPTGDDGPAYPGFDPDRYEDLRRAVRTTHFDMVRDNGYEVTEVDALLDQVEHHLTGDHLSETGRDQVRRLVGNSRFRRAKRIGYDPTEVDALLTRITALTD